MEADKVINLDDGESQGFVYGGLKLKKKYKGCIRCLELYDKVTKANDKCILLELDIAKKNCAIKSLEGKLGFMELENTKIEYEVRVLKQRKEELESSIRDRAEEDDNLNLVMIENKVLECEKKKAESEAGTWKAKCKELETKVLELEKRLLAGMTKTDKAIEDKDESAGTPTINCPSRQSIASKGFKEGLECESKSRVRNCLDFSGEGSPHKNIFPSTPGVRPHVVRIEISDSDDEFNSKNVPISSGVGLNTPDGKELTSKVVVEDDSDDEENMCYIARPPNHPMPKRRKLRGKVSYVVISESESDCDDNIPICRLKSKNRMAQSSEARRIGVESGSRGNRKKHTPERSLVEVGENEEEEENPAKSSYKSTGNPINLGSGEFTNDSSDEDEMEKNDSSSEGESLGGFIVSESDDMSENDDRSGDSENASESSVAYDEVISGLRKGRKNKMSWEYETDMLADLAKCPELCMKGVCAIYRRQTCEEKYTQATIFLNGQGFSQIHASRGSDLAEFLTDGDPHGDVTKTVKELLNFDPKGVNVCRNLATHYSRQLFEIYKNGEDPFFHP